MTSGLVVVDKPAEWTSHDVVARIRRLAGTRKVGHAGTLDPMATGVLIVGVGRATRILGHLALATKSYEATIRLGERTSTDDADGEIVARADASHVTDEDVLRGVAALTGAIEQRPSAVSAIKVQGRRAYARVRAGEDVELPAREVTVEAFEVHGVDRHDGVADVRVSVRCSSGTYVRALARDLGAALGVGGHLTRLRRTRVGDFSLAEARTMDELAAEFAVVDLSAAVRRAFPHVMLGADAAGRLAHGGPVPATGLGPGPVALFAPDGTVVAIVRDDGARARPLAVLADPAHLAAGRAPDGAVDRAVDGPSDGAADGAQPGDSSGR